jgi:pimeloyl-ACP methyl ester carboxylesterase
MTKTIATLAALALGAASVPIAAAPAGNPTTIVLVHGAFVDGSGWVGVHKILRQHGYNVVVVQNPTTSLPDDVAATRRAIAASEGKVVLVGHSYGGVVITEAGSDPKVAALVYVAAFAPDQGESVSSIVASAPPGAPALPILPPVDGLLMLDKTKFAAVFAPDLLPETAQFMADSQQPWGAAALEGKITVPAWTTKPSWYLIPKEDRVIPAAAQHAMAGRARSTIREVSGSHAVYVVDPKVVASMIEEAARVSLASNAGGSSN